MREKADYTHVLVFCRTRQSLANRRNESLTSLAVRFLRVFEPAHGEMRAGTRLGCKLR